MGVTIDELVIADPPEAWTAAGFTVDADGTCRVGSVRLRLAGTSAGRGIVGWSLRDLPFPATELDGIPTTHSQEPPAASAEHPNTVTHVDHLVLLSPDLTRTAAALAAIGVEPRRERDGELGGTAVRQVFFRFDDVILEVVGSPDASGEGPSSLWGITFTVTDVDAVAERLGDRTSPVKDAVQPGRRITTLRHRDLGMSVRTALITPHVRG